MRGIVLFAHGSRDPEWKRPFEAIRERVRQSRPEYPIELAFLDFMAPPLGEAVRSLVEQGALAITVFPLFMAQGGHLGEDLPRMLEELRGAHPHIPIGLEPAIGEAREIEEAIASWILARAG
ncbi:MAG TPA: CbiX/SirB N-terminal domain-containing protein [Usitatibacter sp.]|nr:CbiX/SirB N-terminal domain-containing protein [Usitatibacter sp.]